MSAGELAVAAVAVGAVVYFLTRQKKSDDPNNSANLPANSEDVKEVEEGQYVNSDEFAAWAKAQNYQLVYNRPEGAVGAVEESLIASMKRFYGPMHYPFADIEPGVNQTMIDAAIDCRAKGGKLNFGNYKGGWNCVVPPATKPMTDPARMYFSTK